MTPEDHDLVGEDSDRLGALLDVTTDDGLHAVALSPIDHAHARFRLPPLTVDLLWEVSSHSRAVVAGWRAARRPADLGREDNVLNLAHIDRGALSQEGCVGLTNTPFRRKEPYAEHISDFKKCKSVGATG